MRGFGQWVKHGIAYPARIRKTGVMTTAEPATRPQPKLDPSWAEPLSGMFASPVMGNLRQFLLEEKAAGKRIFPKGSEYFRALDLTPLDNTVEPSRYPAMPRGATRRDRPPLSAFATCSIVKRD